MENEEVTQAGVPAQGQPAIPAAPAAPAAAPAPGTPEYNAQAVAYGQQGSGDVPAKFIREDGSVDVASLAKSYMALESGTGAAPAIEAAPASPEQAITESGEAALEGALESLQIPDTTTPEAEVEVEAPATTMTDGDWEEAKSGIWKTGELSESEAAALAAKTGWDATTVQQWGLAQRAEIQSSFNQAADVVGGHDTLTSMLKWASEALPPEEQKAINSQLRQPGATEYVLLGVKSRYEASTTPEARASQEPAATPRRAVTAPVLATKALGFASHAEFSAARSSVDFTSDPTYRSNVMQRMSETDWSSLPRL